MFDQPTSPVIRTDELMTPALHVYFQGKLTRNVVLKGKLFTIGRMADNDLEIDYMGVSRYHAQIERIDGNFFIQDLGSRFGTFVNHQMVKKHQLVHDDRINLGHLKEVEVVFVHGDKNAEPASTGQVTTLSNNLPFSKETFGKLSLLLEVSRSTQLTLNLKEILDEIVSSVMNLTNADRGYILLKDDRGDLAFKVSRLSRGLEQDQLPPDISWGVVNKVMETGKSQVTGDVQSDYELKKHDSIMTLRLQSIMCIPLIRTHILDDSSESSARSFKEVRDIIGVIYVDSRGSNKIYNLDDVRILETLAGHASVAISNARLFQQEKNKSRQLSRIYVDTVRVLANSVEARDLYTRGHTERVAAMSVILAQEMNWTADQIYYLKIGAYLHDIGKIGVPDAILNKRASLTVEEYAIMKQHPQIGEKIIKGIDFLEPVIPYLLYHQERFNGSGYPYGLSGEKIPIEGRLLAVPDVFDAITSNRPYRGPMPYDFALEEILKSQGILFDPGIVGLFKQCFLDGKILELLKVMKNDEAIEFTRFMARSDLKN